MLKHGTCPIYQGTNRRNIQGIYRLAAVAYTSNIIVCSRKDTSKEESSVNMKIFMSLEDLFAELPSLTKLDIFLSVTSMTRFRIYPVIDQCTFTAKQLFEIWLSTGDILSLKLILLDIKSSITNGKSQIFNKTADQKCRNYKS